jgi:hypothetical protein
MKPRHSCEDESRETGQGIPRIFFFHNSSPVERSLIQFNPLKPKLV